MSVLISDERLNIGFNEYPSFADLCCRDAAGLCSAPEFLGVQLEESCGLFEGERLHWLASAGRRKAVVLFTAGPFYLVRTSAGLAEVLTRLERALVLGVGKKPLSRL
jgi:hypothetical protein